jgi:hypothetical protein
MDLKLLVYGPAAASVDFSSDDLPAVLRQLQAGRDHVTRTPAIDGEIWTVGPNRLFLVNEHDGLSLLAKDRAGVVLLAALVGSPGWDVSNRPGKAPGQDRKGKDDRAAVPKPAAAARSS